MTKKDCATSIAVLIHDLAVSPELKLLSTPDIMTILHLSRYAELRDAKP